LTHYDTRRDLSLVYCEIVGDERVRNLCPRLIHNRGIETLGLGHTSITETGVGYLLQFMQDNVYLKLSEWLSEGTKGITWTSDLNQLEKALVLAGIEQVESKANTDENLNLADWTNATT
jgi:hypothetical protein